MTPPQSADPFDFQAQTRILFGAGRLNELGDAASQLGFKRTLLVSDPGIERAGHVERGVASLRRAGIATAVFDGVEENPTTEHVARGLEAAKKFGIDSIVGLGGGSAMDCAKGINFLITNGGSMKDYWGVGKAGRPMLPMIAIPTTAGTGSETQSFALITDPETHQKMACGDRKAACRAAILDPEVTISMPPSITAATGMDAISHAVESYVSLRGHPLSQAFARQAWHLLSGSFENVLREPDRLDARSGMLLGASLAGLSIENSMLGAAHSLANPLTAHFGISHGEAIGLMLPHVVRFNGTACGPAYGILLGAGAGESGGGQSAADHLARRLEGWRSLARLPERLSDRGVTRESIPRLAQEAAGQWTAQFNPRPVSAGELEEIYWRAFS